MSTSWCDMVACTPGLGFKLKPKLIPAGKVLELLGPELETLGNEKSAGFNVTWGQPYSLQIDGENGYAYGVEPGRIYVEFQHKFKVKVLSGAPPETERLSSLLPFTQLLPELSERLIRSTLLIRESKEHTVGRVGLVATASVAEEDLPPGLSALIDFMGRPWDSAIEGFGFQMTARLDEKADWTDRCSHSFSKTDEPGSLVNLNFDWSRTFNAGYPATSSALSPLVDNVISDALKYFEDLAQGDRFDVPS